MGLLILIIFSGACFVLIHHYRQDKFSFVTDIRVEHFINISYPLTAVLFLISFISFAMLNDGIGKEYDALCNLQEVAIDDYVISSGSQDKWEQLCSSLQFINQRMQQLYSEKSKRKFYDISACSKINSFEENGIIIADTFIAYKSPRRSNPVRCIPRNF